MKSLIIGMLLVAHCGFVYSTQGASMNKYPFSLSYSSNDLSDAYAPNFNRVFDSTVVYTKQLEIQEYLLQRTDFIFLKLKELDEKVEVLNKNLSKIENVVDDNATTVRVGVIAIIIGILLHLIVLIAIKMRIVKESRAFRKQVHSDVENVNTTLLNLVAE